MAIIPYEGEIWKSVPGYDGRYEASTSGRVRTMTGKHTHNGTCPYLLNPTLGTYGYLYVSLMRDGKARKYGLHQLIALTFLGSCPAGLEPDHIDRDKANNRADNLEYVTHAENMRRARASGWNTPRGERCHTAKLTEADVRAIRRDPRSQRVVASDYGVSGVAVHSVRARKTWKGVED